MERNEIIEKLQDIFNKVFPGRNLIVGDVLHSNDVPEWDSLHHLDLILEIEEVFGVKFNVRDVLGMQTTEEMIDILKKKLN
jgi:acyl carrier protein